MGGTYQHTNREVLIEGDPLPVRLCRSRSLAARNPPSPPARDGCQRTGVRPRERAGKDWWGLDVQPYEPGCSDCWDDGVVTESWITTPVTHVRPGDRVRLASGQEVLVSRIEASFLGRENMVAFIEDTPDRWFKQPVQLAAEVEVLRAT